MPDINGRFRESFIYACAVLVLGLSTASSEFVQTPPVNIATYGTVSVSSSTCSSNNYCSAAGVQNSCTSSIGCDSACPTRTSFPTAQTSFLLGSGLDVNNNNSGCYTNILTGGMLPSPGGADTNNGIVVIGPTGGCPVTTDVALNELYFSLSFWVYFGSLDQPTVLTFGKGSTQVIALGTSKETSQMSANNIAATQTLATNTWYFIVLIKQVDKFLVSLMSQPGATKEVTLELTVPYPTPITAGSYELKLASERDVKSQIAFTDMRVYADALTLREVNAIRTAATTLSILPFLTPCRCPRTHYGISDDGLQCSDTPKKQGAIWVNRFNYTKAHFAELMFDRLQAETSWISSVPGKVTVTFVIPTTYQIDELRFDIPQPILKRIVIRRKTSSSSAFKNWHTITDMTKNGDYITWRLSDTFGNAETARSNYENYRVQELEMTFETSDTFLNVVIRDIHIEARYDCYGNAASVTLHEDKSYDCKSCAPSTNTKGTHCSSCGNLAYRQTGDLSCETSPTCNSAGIRTKQGRTREEIGGKCYCKSNVEGNVCDTCRHLTYNLQNTNEHGCTPCSCDSLGTASCDSNTGTCQCRPGVKGPDCAKCISAKDYGRNKTGGCEPCECNTIGSKDQICHPLTGQCTCKKNVERRQCDWCVSGYWNLHLESNDGCQNCDCNKIGSTDDSCDQTNGKCSCRMQVNNNPKCKPTILGISPSFGPLNGETEIVVEGALLWISNIEEPKIYLDNVNQQILFWNDTQIRFLSNSSQGTKQTQLRIEWVGTIDIVTAFIFTYKPDPVVTAVNRMATFKSGGCLFDIQGNNFNSVSSPKVTVTHDGQMDSLNVSRIKTGLQFTSSRSNSGDMMIGLILDGVDKYVNLTKIYPEKGILYVVDDPIIDDHQFFIYENPFAGSITIQGDNLTEACSMRDFHVTLSGSSNIECKIETLTNTEIVCTPEDISWDFSGQLEIEVTIGYFSATIGKVDFLGLSKTNTFIYIAVGVSCFLLLVLALIIVCCCIRYRRRKKSSESSVRLHDILSSADADDGIVNPGYSSPIEETNIRQPSTISHSYLQPISHPNEPVKPPPTPIKPISAIKPMIPMVPVKPKVLNLKKNNNEIFNPDLSQVYINYVKESRDTTETKENFKSRKSTVIHSPPDCIDQFLSKLDLGLKDKVSSVILRSKTVEAENVCTAKGSVSRVVVGKFSGDSSDRALTVKVPIHPVVKENEHPSWLSLVLNDWLKFQDCSHDNVIQFLGMGLDSERFYLLYPNMANRTLKYYLTKDSNKITDFNSILLDVANGMKYLALQGITHKDVASRNCMVDSSGNVFVSDAAFSWDLYPAEYTYDKTREKYMPYRWMAIETLEQAGFYNESTDVWSFGVLVWEVLNHCMIPFDGLEVGELLVHIRDKRVRLGKSSQTPKELASLMTSCWRTEASNRPNFTAIVSLLGGEELYANLPSPS